MARGNNQRGRGGFRGGNFRGRGRGRGGRGRGGGGGGFVDLDEYDFPVQVWPQNANGGGGGNGFRGRGRGGPSPQTSSNIPSPRGVDSPRGRGRGRGDPDFAQRGGGRGWNQGGRGTYKPRAGVPLSMALQDRPLLRPIVFVRSVLTATLFKEEEDILQPINEVVGDAEADHVPTADKVTQVFSAGQEDGESSSDEDQLEEIDFTDIGRLQAEVDAAAAAGAFERPESQNDTAVIEEKFTGFYVDTKPAPVSDVQTENTIIVDRVEVLLGQPEDDDEIIVYDAPNPRSGRATPAPNAIHQPTLASVLEAPSTSQVRIIEETTIAAVQPTETNAPAPSFESVSFSFKKTPAKSMTRRVHPVHTPRSLIKRLRKPRRKPVGRFGTLGAALSETHLREQRREKDPRRHEQRRGDSDVDWGTATEDDEGADAIEELSSNMGAMDLDEDVGMDLEAMKRFVRGMGPSGSAHVTMDDINDEAQLRREDAEERARGFSSEEEGSESEDGDESDDGDAELERVFDAEEQALIGGSEGEEVRNAEEAEESEDDDDEDDDVTPRKSFRTKLEKLRAKSNGKHKEAQRLDDSSDEAMSVQMTWSDDDDAFYAHMEDILDKHDPSRKGRKASGHLFRSIRNGDFSDDDDEYAAMMSPAKRKKDKDIPPELQEQWEKDRQTKAENKRKRAQARLEFAADPLAVHKGGKKGRKAMLAAAKLDTQITIPNRIVDFVSLEKQIRRFLSDLTKNSMALPPADKYTRKNVHELAQAFNLKSVSKGAGRARYTTLERTSMSGININEKKVSRIIRQFSPGWIGPNTGRGGNNKGISLDRHREGEEVGKAAPKIGESNIGFQMLAAMGWSEGDRIGLSGGLEAPLTAIMKKSKLGLGAAI